MMGVSDNETEKIIISCLLIDEEERKKKIRKRSRIWVHSICKKGLQYGEYHTLFPDLLADDVKFVQYYRMTHHKFKILLNILTSDLGRDNTSFRMVVGPKEGLSLCLRYLATGNSSCSLAFNYRLRERTVREIVYSCCEIIWRKLRPIVMPTPDEAMWLKIECAF